jgi:hypothetical protein
MSVWYQPTADGRPFALSLRERRQAAARKGCCEADETAAEDTLPPGVVAKSPARKRAVAAAWAY